MDDLLLAFTPWPPSHMRLLVFGLPLLGLVGALERLARRHFGVVLGLPVGGFDENYPGTIGNARDVDLDPHLYDVGRVEWVTDTRALLLPVDGDVELEASAGARTTSSSTGFMCVGDLRIDARPGLIRFRTRVLLRIVPVLGLLLFIVGSYAPTPWGIGWSLPGGKDGVLWSLGPVVVFGGVFGYNIYGARTGVITAHHAVTSAFMATLRPVETTNRATPAA